MSLDRSQAADASGVQGTNVVGEKTHLQGRSEGEGQGGPIWEVSAPTRALVTSIKLLRTLS